MPASPVQVPGEGPPTITYSISGCAHSAGLGVPRSQAARIERTSSTFADAIDQAWHTRESGGPASPGRSRDGTVACLLGDIKVAPGERFVPDHQLAPVSRHRRHEWP